MKKVSNDSKKMLAISILLLAILIANVSLNYILLDNIENDAELVNSTGMIRGTIQRILKLELNNKRSDDLIAFVDDTLSSGLVNGTIDKVNKDDSYNQILKQLKLSWDNLKINIYNYRQNPDQENKKELSDKSEKIWYIANDTVYSAQSVSQRKVEYLWKLSLITALNLVLAIIIIMLIKRLVKDKLEFLANYDFLTGALNRRALYEIFSKIVKDTKRKDKESSLIMLDIDFFKKVNDSYGHDTGDYILKGLSEVVKGYIGRNDYFARIGGEEFIILLPNAAIGDAEVSAENLRKIIEQYDFEKVGHITISLGVTSFGNGESIGSVIKRADKALYSAKGNGRNRVEVEGNKVDEENLKEAIASL